MSAPTMNSTTAAATASGSRASVRSALAATTSRYPDGFTYADTWNAAARR